jgi:hypothetical protein
MSTLPEVMDLSRVFVWLHDTSFATAIRNGSLLFPWIESVHVLAISLVVGSITIVDLRLIGFASTNRSVATVAGEILPITWIAFAVAVLTGAALFTSHAVGYAQNVQFRLKLLLLLLAGVNMMTFHLVMGRHPDRWNEARMTPRSGKLAGLTSLTLWIGIVALGRWIGFAGVR